MKVQGCSRRQYKTLSHLSGSYVACSVSFFESSQYIRIWDSCTVPEVFKFESIIASSLENRDERATYSRVRSTQPAISSVYAVDPQAYDFYHRDNIVISSRYRAESCAQHEAQAGSGFLDLLNPSKSPFS